MTLEDHIKQCQALIAANPEAANMQVFNTSCFDDPLRFATSGVCIGTVYVTDTGDHRSDDETEDEIVDKFDCVVIEAF